MPDFRSSLLINSKEMDRPAKYDTNNAQQKYDDEMGMRD
jgi:hypothetical protein